MWNIYETCQLQLNVFNSYYQPEIFFPFIDRSEVGHLTLLSSKQRQNLACVLVFVINKHHSSWPHELRTKVMPLDVT